MRRDGNETQVENRRGHPVPFGLGLTTWIPDQGKSNRCFRPSWRMPPSPLLGSIGGNCTGQDDDRMGNRRERSLREPQGKRLGTETKNPPRLGVLKPIFH